MTPEPDGPQAPTRDDAPPRPSVMLHGVRFDAITERECVRHIIDELARGRGGFVVTPNLDHLVRAQRSREYLDLVRGADLSVADGMPLVWASRLQRTPLPERVPGSSLVSSLAAEAARAGRSLFLLGGDPGTADGAAGVLCTRYPGLRIAGTHCPPMGFENDARELEALTARLRAAQPDIVYVGLGSPKQERCIVRLRPLLPRAWWLGVGISFSFLCGQVRRAPPWIQRIGLEWVHRWAQEPARLTRRYFLEGLPFAARLFGRALVNRFRPGARSTRSENKVPPAGPS